MFKFLVLLNYFTITHTHTLPFFFRKMSNEHSDNFSIKLSSDTKMENGYHIGSIYNSFLHQWCFQGPFLFSINSL